MGGKKILKKSINPKILTLISLKYTYFSVFPDFHKDGLSYRNFSPYHFVGKKISNNFCLKLFLVGSIVLEIFAKNLFFFIYIALMLPRPPCAKLRNSWGSNYMPIPSLFFGFRAVIFHFDKIALFLLI